VSRYAQADLDEFLARQLTALYGSPDPSDEDVRDLYFKTQNVLYPKPMGLAPLAQRQSRELAKKLRRALEQRYGWLRQDPRIRDIERANKRVAALDLVLMSDAPPSGVVVLKGGRPGGGDAAFNWYGLVPPQDSRSDIERIVRETDPPLSVLLGHLWHFRDEVDGDTMVTRWGLVKPAGGGQPVLVRSRSATSLSALMESLR
jgi:hypothetical protein